ncbi:MAG: mannitol dehydrogenase family protein [Caulobacteraceae bacterium]|nr:mannitol dehydrogenase family protein [Caulobacteraceae bacterium]
MPRPAYDLDTVTIGVVHLGPGAFHRAHQCAYIDRLLARDPRWGICAVSLKSPAVRDALLPQDGLYILVEMDAEPRPRVIGAIREVLTAADSPAQVLERLASPQTRLVTLTVTEKGYALGADGRLNLTHPDIRHDLTRPKVPASAVGWLTEGLRRRRASGGGDLSVLSCDNISDNGRRLGAAVITLATAQGDADLAAWIAQMAAFPNTMVDAITPATDEALRILVRARLGLEDAWPVQREPYSQWVIEDGLKPGAPDLASAGAILTADVRPFEQAKLRLLNAAHSTLAYLGLLRGLETVAEAMAAPDLAAFVEDLMRQDIAPSLTPPPQLDLFAYIDAILTRFRNPAIRHRLIQIAADGSQKLPVRLLGTIEDALAAGRPIARLCVPIAAWMAFVLRQVRRGEPLADPVAERLAEAVRDLPGDAGTIVDRFLGIDGLFPASLARAPRFRATLTDATAVVIADR